ncbi:MAG: tyrosine-type recombinase/integrase [Eubacteriales bacterium]|nr:tyrosine-type recombinase/integrase [Eubacteriales bacterium]
MKHFLRTVNKHPDEVTLDDARNFLLDKKKSGSSAATCNQYHSAIRFFYKFVLNKPWDGDYVPRMKRDYHQPVVLTLEEVERLIDTAREPRNKALIALIYSSGLRISEAVHLAPSDIYMSTMQVHVRYSKNHSERWTVLSQRALDLLIEYWHSCSFKRDKLFVSTIAPYAPLKTNGAEIVIRQIAKEAGIEKRVYPHLLRHSFATHLLEQGVSLEYIQSLLGHRSPASTSIYLHLSNKSMMGIQNPLDHPKKKKRGRPRKNGGDQNG